MKLTVQQPCPSCGAEILINEDDRLIQCSYCDIHNYRVQQKLPRFVLPARLPSHLNGDALLYLPYLRFKGTIFYCQGFKVHHKLVDTTRTGINLKGIPASLGLKPQAMNVRAVMCEDEGRFARQTIKARTIFSDAARLTQLFSSEKKQAVIHRAFIGETISRVYLPAYVHHSTLYDAIGHGRIGSASEIGDFFDKTMPAKREWEPVFLSTVCPGCAADMSGSRDSLVMTCTNCNSLWQEEAGVFRSLNFEVVESKNNESVYLPFWKIQVKSKGASLETLADMIRLTNQPIVTSEGHRTSPLSFIVPAFKITPQIFLSAGRNLTVAQLAFIGRTHQDVIEGYPVTLPVNEATQSMKSVLAASAVSPKKVFGVLEKLSFHVTAQKLLYLPFHWIGHDVRQDQTGYAFSSASLRFGRTL